MIFQADITIPKNTLSTSPTTVMLQIAKGIITEFKVHIPSGHSRLAHLAILHHETQIAPSIERMWLHGDTFPVEWEDHHESDQPPFELKLKGYNDDDTYPHTFTVYVVVLPRRAVLALALVDAIKSLFSMLSPRRIFTRGS